MTDQIAILHQRINDLTKELKRVRNNSAPTVPIYDSTNFPQDAVEGQTAIAQSSSGVAGENSLWGFRDSAWHELGSAGDIRFNYDNEGGYLYIQTNDLSGTILVDQTPNGEPSWIVGGGIQLFTNPSPDSLDNANAGRIRLVDNSFAQPLVINKSGLAGEGAGIQIFADSGPPGTTPGLNDGDLAIQQFGSGRLYIGSGNLDTGIVQIEAWAHAGGDAGSTNWVRINSVSAHHSEGNEILVGNVGNRSPAVQSIVLANNGGAITIDEEGGIAIEANYKLDNNLYPIEIRGDTIFDELFSFIVRSGLSDPPIPTDPTAVMIYAMGNPTTEVSELWAYCGGVRTRLAHG